MKTIRVGIIGSGGIARGAHIPSYQKVAGVEVVAACDVSEAAARQAAQEFKIPRIYTDYRKMLREEKLDVVSVCTPNAFHMAPAIAALKAGVHVHCEKPLAMNPAEGRAMIAAARKARRLLNVGLQCRYSSEARALKDFIAKGELGKIYFARVQALRRRGVPGWGVFIRKDMSGGGPLIDIGVHMLDLALWLMGHPKPTRVLGNTYCNFGRRSNIFAPWGEWDPKKYTVEDMGVGYVKFATGASLVLEASWAAHIDEDVMRVALVGTEGGAVSSPLKIMQEKHKTLIDVTPQRLPKLNSHAEAIGALIRAIRTGGPAPVPGEQALEATKILDGLYRSSASGREAKV